MGLYDSLFATLKCPATGIDKEIEIQFKWADPCLGRYHLGDQLEIGPYGNIWVPEDYLCDQCSEYEPAKFGRTIKKFVFHNIFIHMNNGKFEVVVTEEQFCQSYVVDGKVILPKGESLFINYFNFKEGKPQYLQKNQVPL